MATAFPLQIFFDGACRVCAAEMETYRKQNPQNRFQFVDISAEGFAAEAFGKSQDQFMAELHVRDAEGNFFTAIDAFMMIWQAYPSGSFWRLVSALVSLPGINNISRFCYNVFARNRHLLPKRKQDCASGSCKL